MQQQAIEEVVYGVSLTLKYLGFRKRKPVSWSTNGKTHEEALNKAKEWRSKNGGKFLGGSFCRCEFRKYKGLKGEEMEMTWVELFAPTTAINNDQFKFIN